MAYNTKIVFGAACLGMLLFGVTLITLGAVATDLTLKYNLTEIQVGTLFSILPLGILSGSLVFGPIADKHGYKLLLAGAAFLLFIGIQGIALMPSYIMALPFVYFFGLAGGVLNGATNGLVADISPENKAANLSILGIFFAIGALGMPSLLGVLKELVSFEVILSSVGVLAIIMAVGIIFIAFPPPKSGDPFQWEAVKNLTKSGLLLLIAVYLFFQSGMEGLINNWTTLFTTNAIGSSSQKALFALSLHVGGMAVMRMLIGSVLRNYSYKKLMTISFFLLIPGIGSLNFAQDYFITVIAMVLLGAGLAAGYPVMLGLLSDHFQDQSGTAFSIVLAIALLGNMFLNYFMGILASTAGIESYPILGLVVIITMGILYLYLFKTIKN
jgi:MFS transporter, FHS family, glucose/mannose:H+ symporter